MPDQAEKGVDWENWKPQTRTTLLFIKRGHEVLLIRKKRGLGAGKINGPGGKIDEGEEALDSAIRETREEVGLTALAPEKRGELHFQSTDGLAIHCTIFVAEAHEGEAVETDEATPLWTPIDQIPYAEMWEDDEHWLPQALAGQNFQGWFLFDGDTMLEKRVVFEEKEALAAGDEDAQVRHLSRIVESVLIASESPLSSKALVKLIRKVAEETEGLTEAKWLKKIGEADIADAVRLLREEYEAQGRAFTVAERAAGWKIFTVADYAHWVRAVYPEQKPTRLSAPALETLAIIAYRQPITRADIEAVRGVNIDGVMKVLLDRGLVQIGGRADAVGRPLLYQTTDVFLDHFGIKTVDDLPNAAELRQVKFPTAAEAGLGETAASEETGESPAETQEEEAPRSETEEPPRNNHTEP